MRFMLIIMMVWFACGCAPSTSAPELPALTRMPGSATPAPGTTVQCKPPYPTGTPTAESVFCADPSTLKPAPVVRVVDGDTIRVRIEGVEEPVRFYGIDTSERGEPCFDEATDRTRELVADEVLLLSDARDRDGFDRLLRYVYTPKGLSVDAVLVAEGLAYAWREDGALREQFSALEDLARGLRRGCLWAEG